MENTQKIFPAMGKAMAKIKAIGKDQKNNQQGWKFRGIDDVMTSLHDILAESGIFLLTECHIDQMMREDRETRNGTALTYTILPITFHFVSAEDGSEVTVTTIGEGMDSGDKGINKAESIALKYACLQAFMIPTEDIAEPDRDAYEVKAKGKKAEAPAKTQKKDVPKEVVDAMTLMVGGVKLGMIWKDSHDLFDAIADDAEQDPHVLEACEIIRRYKGEIK